MLWIIHAVKFKNFCFYSERINPDDLRNIIREQIKGNITKY